jgi:hypothetical protein
VPILADDGRPTSLTVYCLCMCSTRGLGITSSAPSYPPTHQLSQLVVTLQPPQQAAKLMVVVVLCQPNLCQGTHSQTSVVLKFPHCHTSSAVQGAEAGAGSGKAYDRD